MKRDTSSWDLNWMLTNEANMILTIILPHLATKIETEGLHHMVKFSILFNTIEKCQGWRYENKLNMNIDKLLALQEKRFKDSHITVLL